MVLSKQIFKKKNKKKNIASGPSCRLPVLLTDSACIFCSRFLLDENINNANDSPPSDISSN